MDAVEIELPASLTYFKGREEHIRTDKTTRYLDLRREQLLAAVVKILENAWVLILRGIVYFYFYFLSAISPVPLCVKPELVLETALYTFRAATYLVLPGWLSATC